LAEQARYSERVGNCELRAVQLDELVLIRRALDAGRLTAPDVPERSVALEKLPVLPQYALPSCGRARCSCEIVSSRLPPARQRPDVARLMLECQLSLFEPRGQCNRWPCDRRRCDGRPGRHAWEQEIAPLRGRPAELERIRGMSTVPSFETVPSGAASAAALCMARGRPSPRPWSPAGVPAGGRIRGGRSWQ
jgi:hypothetical protein